MHVEYGVHIDSWVATQKSTRRQRVVRFRGNERYRATNATGAGSNRDAGTVRLLAEERRKSNPRLCHCATQVHSTTACDGSPPQRQLNLIA